MGNKASGRLYEFMIGFSLLPVIVITLYPLLHVAFASVSRAEDLIANRGILWHPLGFDLGAYLKVLDNPEIMSGYANTLWIVFGGVSVSMIMTSLAAFVLSRSNVLLNKFFIFFIVFTMFFSGGLIPLYLVVKGTGLINSLGALIIPFAVNTFHLIIMRTAFKAIPVDLEESAKMDGANHFTVMLRIILPLSLPVIAVITLYSAVERWNGWFFASIFLKDRDLYPLQLVLREILIANSTESMAGGAAAGDLIQLGETIKYASTMVAVVPILFLYPFLQKYFVKGVMVGALKE